MDKYEKLISETPQDVTIDENYPFKGKLSGLYVDGNIALSDKLKTSKEKACVLAEELGHHHTSHGNIIDFNKVSNRKQEHRARMWAYNKMVGLMGLIKAFERKCHDMSEMADYLDVTEEFLKETINYYATKYGTHTTVDNYIVFFAPSFGVLKLI